MPNELKIKALAVNGGSKAVTVPFAPRRHFAEEEIAAATRVMTEAMEKGVAPGYGGPEETALGEEFAAMLGGGYADGVNSGTTSVYVALRALEVDAFTEIIAPPVSDPGGIMPIVMANCIPIIADSEVDSFNMSLESIKARYTENTSAIIVPHIAGEPADMEGIMAFAKEKGIKVVEDCAQAHGASINGKPVGTFGDTSGFSMMFGKHICVGGQGGMVYTKSEELYWKVRQHADRGKPFGLKGYDNVVGSLNFNMDEIHAAIGRVQIKKTQAIAEGRRRVVDAIKAKLSDIPCLYWNKLPEGALPSYWFLRTMFKPGYTSCNKVDFCKALIAEGVTVNIRYAATPYTADWYTKRNVYGRSGYPWAAPEYKGDKNKYYTLADVPNADAALDNTIITYPLESWTDENIEQFSDAFHKVYEAYKLD